MTQLRYSPCHECGRFIHHHHSGWLNYPSLTPHECKPEEVREILSRCYTLKIPYAEKDAVKKAGAKWSFHFRVWYIPQALDERCFSKKWTVIPPGENPALAQRQFAA